MDSGAAAAGNLEEDTEEVDMEEVVTVVDTVVDMAVAMEEDTEVAKWLK